jgi:hypothetical protein
MHSYSQIVIYKKREVFLQKLDKEFWAKKHVGTSYDYVKNSALLQTHTHNFNTCNTLPYAYDLQDKQSNILLLS